MTLLSTPAVLLRSHPFSETSLILRFFTESHGIQGMVAKGVRKAGGKKGGTLSTFAQGTLTLHYRDRRDLQTFRDFALSNPRRGLATHPLRLAGASVLGELILQHAGSDGNPDLFNGLARGLDAMEEEATDALIPRLLAELWALVRELGYGPALTICAVCGRPLETEGLLRFDFACGGLRCPTCQEEEHGPRLGPEARRQLAQLLDGSVPQELLRPRAHLRLASDFITYHISGGNPLRSFEVLYSLIQKGHA